MERIWRNSCLAGLALVMLGVGTGCGESADQQRAAVKLAPEDIRRPNPSMWYPNDAIRLEGQVRRFLDKADVEPIEGIVGLVVPHAGYMYSGQVAAYAFKPLVGKRYETVVLIGPSHVEPFAGCSVYARGGYETPLGVVPVDVALAKAVASRDPGVFASDKGHRQEHLPRREHSLENELPFLQVVLEEFKLVPIVVGDPSRESCEALGNVLGEALKNRNALMVASSDLSHFHDYDTAVKLDRITTNWIQSLDAGGFCEDLQSGRCEACGGGAVAALMVAAKKLGADTCELLRYANSGDITGDKESVVGYAACVIHGGGRTGTYLERLQRIKDQMITLANSATRLFSQYQQGGIAEDRLILEMQSLARNAEPLYRESGNLPLPAPDYKDYDQACQSLFATVQNMFLFYSERGLRRWERPDREWLFQDTVKRYREDLGRVADEEKKIHSGGAMGRIQYSPLDEPAQKELLSMARAALESYARNGKVPKFEPKYEGFKEKRGVFVTLTEHGQLRGCIGHHEADVPLCQLVPQMAIAAGFRDPRFPPVTEQELDSIKVKVSVYLTNVYEIDDTSQFEMGKHGIIMYKGGRAATYLPEVPLEAGWKTKEEELSSLCLKAGLPPDAWKEGARFELYETQVFGEE